MNNAIEFPHPVLNEYLHDYVCGTFSLKLTECRDNGDKIEIDIEYLLDCDGLIKFIKDGYAQVVIRAKSGLSSFRKAYQFDEQNNLTISIDKKYLCSRIALNGFIIAKKPYDSFKLESHNSDYFKGHTFKIKKGDILADEHGIEIDFDDSTLEKPVSSIFQIHKTAGIDRLRVNFSSDNEYSQYNDGLIHIELPESEYYIYHDLRKKYSKFGIRRFLQNALILPALTEAIDLLRNEEDYEDSDSSEDSEVPMPKYSGTVWADSIRTNTLAIERDLYDRAVSSFQLTNELLDNVVVNSLKDLQNKMKEWTTGDENRIGGID